MEIGERRVQSPFDYAGPLIKNLQTSGHKYHQYRKELSEEELEELDNLLSEETIAELQINRMSVSAQLNKHRNGSDIDSSDKG